jgi:hypothetical protein
MARKSKFGKYRFAASVFVLLVVLRCSQEGPGSRPPSSSSSSSPASSASSSSSLSTTGSSDRIEIPLDGELGDEEASLARNFYFIFDGSGSMGEKPDRKCRGDQRFPSKLAGAQWAVSEFLSKVPEEIHLGLYVFDDNGRREVVPVGKGNRQAFLAAIQGVQDGGGTPLAEAIALGTEKLVEQYKRQLGYGEYRLVVVTDGRADDIPEAADLAARYGFPIYAIGLCIEEDHPLRRAAVSYRAADNFGDLARGLEETLAELPSFDATEFEDGPGAE